MLRARAAPARVCARTLTDMREFASAEYQRFRILDEHNQEVLVPSCYRALTGRARRKGLLGCDGLAPGYGLLLGEGVVHMAGMRFSLDLVFLARDHTVLKIVEGVGPGWRLHGSLRARWTLEMAAGEAAGRGLSSGRKLHFEDLPQ